MALERKMQDSAHYRPNALARLATGVYIAYQFFGGGVDKAVAQQYGNEPRAQQPLAGQMLARLPPEGQQRTFDELYDKKKPTSPQDLVSKVCSSYAPKSEELVKQGKYKELVELLESPLRRLMEFSLTRMTPDERVTVSSAYNNLGIGYGQIGRSKEEIDFYKLAIFINPKSATAHGNLGNVLYDQGLLREALSEYETGGRLDPDNARFKRWIKRIKAKIDSNRSD